MNKLIAVISLIIFLYYVGKPIYLSKEKYREYYFTKWDKYVINEGTPEQKFKRFRLIQLIISYFIIILLIVVLFTPEVIYLFFKALEIIVSIYRSVF